MPGTSRKKAAIKRIKDVDYKVALGMLLWGIGAVAGADGKFQPEEDNEIRKILLSHTKISQQDLPIILTAIHQAGVGKINVYRQAREIDKKLPYQTKILIIEDLFQVAYVDKVLDKKEEKIIKNISDLLHVNDKDFVETKRRILIQKS